MDLPDKSTPVETPRVKKEPVIPRGAAKPVERAARRRFWDFVIAESPKHVVAQVAQQTLLPRSKAVLEEVLQGVLHGILWNNGTPSPGAMITRGTVIRGNGVVVNTNDYAALSSPTAQAAQASNSMTGPYQDLIVASVAHAEHLLASLYADLNQYNVVTVADLYEAAALQPSTEHSNLGWYGLDGARIVQERNGVKLMLPKPVRV